MCSNDEACFGQLLQRVPRGWSFSDTTPDYAVSLAHDETGWFRVCAGASRKPFGTASQEAALAYAESAIETAVARRSPHLFIHAGVVSWNDAIILLPGRSMSGKSSLVIELTRQGAGYFSDEYAVIDPTALVYPFPRPLSIRGEQKQRIEIGPSGAGPLPIGFVAAVRFRHGGTFDVRPISRAEMMMELMKNTVMVRERPETAMAVLSRALAEAHGVRGRRGEAEQAAAQILRMATESKLGTQSGISTAAGL